MRILFYSFLICVSFACNESTSKTTTATAATSNSPNSPTKTVGQAPSNTAKPKLVGNGVKVYAEDADAKNGEEVCVDMKVKGVSEVVSMQYSISWDKGVLDFLRVQNFNLKDLSKGNFGTSRIKDGILTFSWYDFAVKGVSVPDETVIHQMCFQTKGKKGSKSKIMISDSPVVIEVTGTGNKFLKFFSDNGYVRVKG